MPVLEKYEVQENQIWYRAEVTEEQLKEFEEAEDGDYPDWVWDLDWDLENDRPGSDELMSIEVVSDDEV